MGFKRWQSFFYGLAELWEICRSWNRKDSSAVQHQLQNVRRLCATRNAFAAIRAETWRRWQQLFGSVGNMCFSFTVGSTDRLKSMLWGLLCLFNNSWHWRDRERLRGNLLTKDGSVVVWGDANDGGDCRKVNDQFHDVQLIAGSGNGETAIRWSWLILATLHHVLRCIQRTVDMYILL